MDSSALRYIVTTSFLRDSLLGIWFSDYDHRLQGSELCHDSDKHFPLWSRFKLLKTCHESITSLIKLLICDTKTSVYFCQRSTHVKLRPTEEELDILGILFSKSVKILFLLVYRIVLTDTLLVVESGEPGLNKLFYFFRPSKLLAKVFLLWLSSRFNTLDFNLSDFWTLTSAWSQKCILSSLKSRLVIEKSPTWLCLDVWTIVRILYFILKLLGQTLMTGTPIWIVWVIWRGFFAFFGATPFSVVWVWTWIFCGLFPTALIWLLISLASLTLSNVGIIIRRLQMVSFFTATSL